MSNIKIIVRKKIEEDTDINTVSSVHALIFKDNKILVYKGLRGWDIPGGHIEDGENFITALVREIKEETKVVIYNEKSLIFFAKLENSDHSTYKNKSMLFAVTKLSKDFKGGYWMNVDSFLKEYSQTKFKSSMIELVKKAKKYI